ncbi:hypothetical protein SAMN02799630_03795 [Paenibacillus sp. UNCCL117]|uniref:hypothetical protein n=1 Tax=unclassified Paenibacillus TaxID=185978 RepID=UPI0008859046|nr:MULTISPECIES: hypothetical protein [unclassified Paenibacillus]SDD47683.1 hypothetical protein SAMN04488602_1091 [Paenibacillus sp. cl123]SFW50389.1 hypothetical protein SAMN02799630_03795 [Paenibacillus sp. UNCCL117]
MNLKHMEGCGWSEAELFRRPWSLQTQDGAELEAGDSDFDTRSGERGAWPVTIWQADSAQGAPYSRTEDLAAVYGKLVRRAERTWIVADAHTYFVVDRIETEEPARLLSSFRWDNGDGRLNVNVASPVKLVLRRLPEAMKFFLVESCADGRPDDGGLIREQPEPGLFVFGSGAFSRSHLSVYAIAADAEEHIRKWHIVDSGDGGHHVEPPDRAGGFALGWQTGAGAGREAAGDRLLGRWPRLKLEDRYRGRGFVLDHDGWREH